MTPTTAAAVNPTQPSPPTSTPAPSGTAVPPSANSFGVSEIKRFSGHSDYVFSVAFTSDGQRLLSGGQYETILWNVATGQPVWRHDGTSAEDIAITSDGRFVVAADYYGTSVNVLDGNTGNVVRKISTPDTPESVAITPDNRYVLVGVRLAFVDGVAVLYDLETGAEVRRYASHDDPVRNVSVSTDGTRVLAATYNGLVVIWDFNTGEYLTHYEGGEISVQAAVFAPNSHRAAFVAFDVDARTIVFTWDADTGVATTPVILSESNEYEAMALHPDGNRLLVGHDEGILTLWDIAAGKEIGRAAVDAVDKENDIFGVAWTADGRYAAYAGTDDLQSVRMVEFK